MAVDLLSLAPNVRVQDKMLFCKKRGLSVVKNGPKLAQIRCDLVYLLFIYGFQKRWSGSAYDHLILKPKQ